MADDLQTLADLAKVNSMDINDLGATDIFNDAPLIGALNSDTATNGTEHKYVVESGAPVVGFREPNAGRDHDKSTDRLVTVGLKILDASHHTDCKVADAYLKGGSDAWMAREGRRHLRAGFAAAEHQLLYGVVSEDADGFTGLADADSLQYSDSSHVIDAGHAGGPVFDVWLIRSTADHANVDVILGNDGEIEIRDYFRQFVPDATGKLFPAYMQEIDAWMGLQVGALHSVVRITNINAAADAAAAVLTDDLLDAAAELFPETAPPTHIAMNKRGRKQLRQSRTATRPDGQPAPMPMEWEGVPIITTQSVKTLAAPVGATP